MSRSAAIFALVILSVVGIAQHAWYWPQLPDKVATHFGWNGQADAWQDKHQAVWVMLAFQLGTPWLLLGIAALAARAPASMVSIPRREYWLAPERRHATMAYVLTIMSWFAVITSLFTMGINHLTFLANRDGAGLNTLWFSILLGLFLAGTAATVGTMAWRFSRVSRDA